MDLRLFEEVSVSTPMAWSTLKGSKTSRLETIANKVVKYMLTDQGSDMLEPYYGIPQWTLVYNDMSRLTYEISNTLSKCEVYIKAGENKLPDTTEKLAKLSLVKLDASSRVTLHVHLSILTTFNNYALLDVSKK